MNTITLEEVQKSFKDNEIIVRANAEFTEGKIYGIQGPNGSGKSVLLQLICGLLKPTHGTVRYNGVELDRKHPVLPSCGIIINKPAFFQDLDGFHNLKLLAKLKGVIKDDDIQEIMGKVQLKNDKKPVQKYSLGMQQRLGIAQAIMENPDVLILDEFSNALDADGVALIYDILKDEKTKGKIIIVTSHIAEDLKTLCDETFILKEGILYHE